MDKIKKKIIQDMLVKLGWKVEPINEFMQRLEDVMDSEFISAREVSHEFDGWYDKVSNDSIFKVVKTETMFTARQCSKLVI